MAAGGIDADSENDNDYSDTDNDDDVKMNEDGGRIRVRT